MKLLIDGIIFQKSSHGGISRIFKEILPKMCDQEPDLDISIFIDGPLLQDLPFHPQINVIKAPPIRRKIEIKGYWKKILDPLRRIGSNSWQYTRRFWMGRGEGQIWHSTYYTYPVVWSGHQVVTIHDMVHELFPDIYNTQLDDIARQQKKRCVENSDAIICISESTRRDLDSFYNTQNKEINIIPPAYNPIFRRLANNLEIDGDLQKVQFLLFVGNRTHHKNFIDLIEAYRLWYGRHDVSLVVVGPPWTSEEKIKLEEFGVKDRIHLFSNITDETLCKLYNQALAFVYPSKYEGFGIPLLEAMACGCPIIASRIPSTIEVAGKYPVYFDLNNIESQVKVFNKVFSLGEEKEREQIGILRAKKFNWEQTAQQTLDVYRSLVYKKKFDE